MVRRLAASTYVRSQRHPNGEENRTARHGGRRRSAGTRPARFRCRASTPSERRRESDERDRWRNPICHGRASTPSERRRESDLSDDSIHGSTASGLQRHPNGGESRTAKSTRSFGCPCLWLNAIRTAKRVGPRRDDAGSAARCSAADSATGPPPPACSKHTTFWAQRRTDRY